MGWVVQRQDGSYRAWCSNAQDEPLRPGERYVQMASPPTITLPSDLQDVDVVRDAYVIAKDAVQAMVADPTANGKQVTAIVRVGQCLEELLKFLNRRIS